MSSMVSVFRFLRISSLLCVVSCSTAWGSHHPAINDPDRFAWQLFSEINKPADVSAPDGAVVWESWALARDVFADPHVAPSWPASAATERNIKNLEARPLQQVVLEAERHGMSPEVLQRLHGNAEIGARVDPAVLQRNGNETRMNRPTFDFIVKNDLYFLEGQELFFQQGRKVDFPIESQEIKAQWRRLEDPAEYSRYHTAKVKRGDTVEIWGLTSLHITTKDLPNWFWATFEHTDNPGREAVVPSRDSFGLAADGGPSPKLINLFKKSGLGKKWENYILRGTQVDFVDSLGRPTLLASSQIERGFQATSSCITCHARASIGPKPRQSFDLANPQGPNDRTRLSVFESNDPARGSVGIPRPSWFVDSTTSPAARKMTQLDFVWSLFRAKRRIPFPQATATSTPSGRALGGDGSAKPNAGPCGVTQSSRMRALSDKAPTENERSILANASPLERSALNRAVTPQTSLNAEEYSKIIQSANQFASTMAGDDDAEFTRLATTAVSQAVLARGGGSARGGMGSLEQQMMLTSFKTMPPPSAGTLIWETPAVRENYRKLMNRASKPSSGLFPITGPPLLARVVGPGTQLVKKGKFRDCVAVGMRLQGQDNYCCTGTLVAPRVVVTAGHCFFCTGGGADNAVVYVGSDIDSPGKTYLGKVHRHPQYSSSSLLNDLAVIVLDSPVKNVVPRPIATTEQINKSSFLRVVGFGNSDHHSSTGFGTKRMVDVPIASHDCTLPEDHTLGCHQGLEIVAGFVGLGPDSCNGDSGGPSYVLVGDDARDDSAWVVASAVSRATDLATRPCGDGGANVRLDKYLDFINKFVQETSGEEPKGKKKKAVKK